MLNRNLCLALLAVAFAIIALPLGTWGYWLVIPATLPPQSTAATFSDALYRALQLFLLNREDDPGSLNWQVHVARFLAPASTLGGVWLALENLRRQVRLLWRAWRGKHHIVCGLGQKGMATLRSSEHDVIAIERHGEPADLAALDALRVPLLRGSATDRNLLLSAGVMRARQITIACGNDDEDVRIAKLAIATIAEPSLRKLADRGEPAASAASPDRGAPVGDEAKSRVKTVIIAPHLDDAETRTLMRHYVDAINRRLATSPLHFQYIDYCHQERAARRLWSTHPLDHQPIRPDSKSHPHLVLIGFGRMGQAVMRQALHIAHYPSASNENPNEKQLRVDIFDAHAERLWRHFCGRQPNFADPSLSPIAEVTRHDGNVIDSKHLTAIGEIVLREPGQVTIVVAVDTEAEAALIVSHLPQTVAERDVPVCVRIEAPGGLAELMNRPRQQMPGEPPSRRTPRVLLFGHSEATVARPEDLAADDELAMALHENYQQRFAKGKPTKRSELPWPQLDEEYRDSNRRAADLIPVLFRSFGYEIVPRSTLANRIPLESASQLPPALLRLASITEHRRWYAERYLAGWRLAEPAQPGEDPQAKAARDFAQKKHACMVPWHLLPAAEKLKDRSQVGNYIEALAKLKQPMAVVAAADPRA